MNSDDASDSALGKELQEWAIVSAENPESAEALVFRLRQTRPAVPGIELYTDAISVNWRYESDTGMPPPDVKQEMDDFEDAVDTLTWQNDFSQLMLVTTGIGNREWVFYSNDKERFMTEFNHLLSRKKRFPLVIEFYDDPEWEVWKEVAEPVAKRGKPRETET